MEFPRETPTRRPIPERVHDFLEVYNPFPEEMSRHQEQIVNIIRGNPNVSGVLSTVGDLIL